MAGDGRVNSSKFKDLFHTKPSMIARDQVEAITGFAPGGVCPFNGKVLFLKPEKNLFLSEINNALHTLLLPEFKKAKEIAKKISLPLEAAIEELAVYHCSPFLKLKKYKLSR